MLQKIERINDIIAAILTVLGSLCFLGLILVVLLQIATRLFLPWPAGGI